MRVTTEDLKAHQQKMNHEFLEWVDNPKPGMDEKRSLGKKQQLELNSDISSLGELELVECSPKKTVSMWIEIMQRSERHNRGLMLYSLSQQAQTVYLPNRLYIIDLISRICAERNCSKWVFFNTINLLDIFLARTTLKLDAGFRTYAEVCIFISQKLDQKTGTDYSKPPAQKLGLASKIHPSSALETTILQTVEGLAPEHNLSSWVTVLAQCWDEFAATHKQIRHDIDRHKILFFRRGRPTIL
jgi:Cyclin, N-terminal domain